MSERIQRRRSRKEAESVPAGTSASVKQPVDYDEILAEIDRVLEKDAAEYVRNFVQKGGE